MTIKNNIQDQIEILKKDPMDINARLALIQYYCIDANWDKALKATQQYLKLNPQDQNTKILFQYNIECEIQRLQNLIKFEKFKHYSGQDLNVQNKLLSSYINKVDYAELEQQYVNIIESKTQTYNLQADQSYHGRWTDTDFRFNDLIEIFVQDQYFVLDINEISELSIRDNEYLTDLLWRRAEIILKDQRQISCFIPARYPIFANDQISDQIKLNKSTAWEMVGNLSIAYGQKTYTNGEVDVGLLDIKQLKLSTD